MLIGYLRPYQDDVNCKIQLEILMELGCDRFFTEEHSSPKKRVMLKKMINELQPGDTIVVAKLFSFADSTRHLAELLNQLKQKQAYLYSVGEGIDTNHSSGYSFHDSVNHLLNFQSDVISENTKKGLYEAKQKGIKAGRPRKPDENVKRAIHMYQSQKYSLAQIKEETGISKTTLYRYLES
ncbi:recombinase family protein [Paenibacillus elgii]|uniref:recombinase family protein n=1 Tax=Paenibacillus elgii TaxID=189691 RepID=UPI0013D268CB|nr:recombinase family protein [Paenibacillus elgii]